MNKTGMYIMCWSRAGSLFFTKTLMIFWVLILLLNMVAIVLPNPSIALSRGCYCCTFCSSLQLLLCHYILTFHFSETVTQTFVVMWDVAWRLLCLFFQRWPVKSSCAPVGIHVELLTSSAHSSRFNFDYFQLSSLRFTAKFLIIGTFVVTSFHLFVWITKKTLVEIYLPLQHQIWYVIADTKSSMYRIMLAENSPNSSPGFCLFTW